MNSQIILLISSLLMILAYVFCSKYDFLKKPENYKVEVVHFNAFDKKISKFEKRCKVAIESLTRTKFVSVRPDFLVNPVTGKNLEIDLFNEELKIAVEADGVQHSKFSPYFHKNKSEYKYQKLKDEYKNLLCKNNKIVLIRVPYYISSNIDIYNYLYEQLLTIDNKDLFLYYNLVKFKTEIKVFSL